MAVPYLERAINVNSMVDGIAIRGLERIGDANTVRALAAIMSDPADRRDRAAQARNALHAISKRTSDPQLREEIGRALENYKERAP